MIYYN